MIDIKKFKEIAQNFTVLYADDDEQLRTSISKYLKKIFKTVYSAENGRLGLEIYKKNPVDIVITDIIMPELNGVQMSDEIKKINNNQDIIVISASTKLDYFLDTIKIGIDGYMLKPINFDQMNELLYKVVLKLHERNKNIEYKNRLENLVKKAGKKLVKQESEESENYQQMLYALVDLIEQRDTYTGGHSSRVARYSKLIAQKMSFSKEECENIFKAGMLHDIGKIAIPDSILLKPESLNEIEYKLIQQHVNIGYKVLKKIPIFKDIAGIIKNHHEKYDGSGYPNSLKGNDIPIFGHIMAVADTFDAMTTNRIYKRKKSITEAINEIVKLSGIQFSPQVVTNAREVLKDIKIIDNAGQTPESQLEKERFSYFYKDQLTKIYNSSYLDLSLFQNRITKKYSHINLLLLNNFNAFNKEHGWAKGNEMLLHVANTIKKLYPKSFVFRIDGDDFAILSDISITFKPILDLLQDTKLTFSTQAICIIDKKIFSLNDLRKIID